MKLETNKYYHLYNRGNNREKLFYSDANNKYFLQRFLKHCFHVFDTYAFCLMNNHFHFVVSVRPTEVQHQLIGTRPLKSKKLQSPSKHLGNFFSSYTQSINKQEGRVGSLFQKNFKRREIDSEEYFQRLIVYVHQNPVHHRFTKSIYNYPYSSFHHYLNLDNSFLNREKTLSIFGGWENFIEAHKEQVIIQLPNRK